MSEAAITKAVEAALKASEKRQAEDVARLVGDHSVGPQATRSWLPRPAPCHSVTSPLPPPCPPSPVQVGAATSALARDLGARVGEAQRATTAAIIAALGPALRSALGEALPAAAQQVRGPAGGGIREQPGAGRALFQDLGSGLGGRCPAHSRHAPLV